MVKVAILVLFLILGGKPLLLNMLLARGFIRSLYNVKIIPLYLQFECFYYEKVLGFVVCFFCIN